MIKRYRVPKLKNGELRVYYGVADGERTPDICFAWQGNNRMRADSSLLYYEFACDKPDHSVLPIFSKMNPSLLKELDLRGYDLKTLKFSIMKKTDVANQKG